MPVCLSVSGIYLFIHQWALGALPTFLTIVNDAAVNMGEQIRPHFQFFVDLLGSVAMC